MSRGKNSLDGLAVDVRVILPRVICARELPRFPGLLFEMREGKPRDRVDGIFNVRNRGSFSAACRSRVLDPRFIAQTVGESGRAAYAGNVVSDLPKEEIERWNETEAERDRSRRNWIRCGN